jgi:hypothetical protein
MRKKPIKTRHNRAYGELFLFGNQDNNTNEDSLPEIPPKKLPSVEKLQVIEKLVHQNRVYGEPK